MKFLGDSDFPKPTADDDLSCRSSGLGMGNGFFDSFERIDLVDNRTNDAAIDKCRDLCQLNSTGLHQHEPITALARFGAVAHLPADGPYSQLQVEGHRPGACQFKVGRAGNRHDDSAR